jgi:hypothetical protein
MHEGATLVEGTRFRLVPVEAKWRDEQPHALPWGLLNGESVWENMEIEHHLGVGDTGGDYLGEHPPPLPWELPAWDGCEPEIAWTVQGPRRWRTIGVWLWRRADAEYIARQLHAVVGIVRGKIDLACPWLALVAPLLNRGVPQELLVGCREFVEATR